MSDSSNSYVGYSGNSATYTPGGSLVTITNGHTGSFAGIVTTNSYTNRLQPAVLSVTNPTQTIFSLSYGFNPGHDNGNVQQIVNGLDSTRGVAFTYDPLNRISQANTTTTTGANCWGETYTIDAWGNLTNIAGVPTMTGCSTESQNVPVSTNNRITGWCYDGAGNLLDMGSCGPANHSFVYDAEGHLQSPPVVGSTNIAFTYYYDGDGNRVQKCIANPCTSGSTAGTLYWFGAGGNVLNESSRTGTMQAEYVYFNGQRIARRDLPSGNVHYYFSNHLGSASLITDSSGNIQQQTDYYPYGGVAYNAGADANRYKFTGKERDTESGLDEFGARYYSSSLGRFMIPDWATKPTNVPYAHFGNPQSLNLYSYVNNNPTTTRDPDGHCPDGICMDIATMSPQQVDQVAQATTAAVTSQPGIGVLELSSAYLTAGASLEAMEAGAALKAAIYGIGSTGLAVSGTSRIIGTATGVPSDDLERASTAVTTSTNPAGMAMTIGTGGNMKAGAVAADLSSAATIVAKPAEAAKDPGGTALTVNNVVQDVKAGYNAVVSFVSPPSPPPPPTPPPPRCTEGDQCH